MINKRISEVLNDGLWFNEEEHKYFNDKNQEYISTSNFVSLFKNEFDPYGYIARGCAKREGISVEEIQARWEKTKNDSCEKGNRLHSDMEVFIKSGFISPDSENKSFIDQFSKIKFKGKLYSEQIIFSNSSFIAGTADLIEVKTKNKINLYDFKTNKALNKESKYDKWMLPPVNHLPDCNFFHYTLQLSVYAYILEEWGYWVENMVLFYINYETGKIESHELQYLRNDIKNMISYREQLKNRSDFLIGE